MSPDSTQIKCGLLDEMKLFFSSLNFSRSEKTFLWTICLACAIVLLCGLNADSPLCFENDEYCYAEPALKIVLNNDPNPHWFANPASTLIYPLAAYYKLLSIFFGDLYVDPSMSIYNMCHEHMFALITLPRLISVFCTLACLPVLYIFGRRWLGVHVAMLGTLFFAFSPQVLYYGEILRADMLSVLLIILTLLFLDFLCEHPSRESLSVAIGILAGLALSTRYFCLALMPAVAIVFGTAYLKSKDKDVRKQIFTNALLCGVVWYATFCLTSPYVLIDFTQVSTDLYFEAKSDFQDQTGLGPASNFLWYLYEGIPYCIGGGLCGASVIGFFLVLQKPTYKTKIFLFLLSVFYIGTCLNPRHWQRWALPMLPILTMLAALTITRAYQLFVRLFTKRYALGRARCLSLVLTVALTGVAMFTYIRHLLIEQFLKEHPGSRTLMYPYILTHIPKGAKIAVDMDWNLPGKDNYDVHEDIWRPDFIPPRSHNYYFPVDLAKDGYQYMLVQGWNRDIYRHPDNAEKYPREHAFFMALRDVPLMLNTYRDDTPWILGQQTGDRQPPLALYDLRSLVAPKSGAKPVGKPSGMKPAAAVSLMAPVESPSQADDQPVAPAPTKTEAQIDAEKGQ